MGRTGCRATNCGSTAAGHKKECRKRIMGELEKAGDERIENETERYYEYLEEEEEEAEEAEENKRKQAKTEETIGGVTRQQHRRAEEVV